MTTRLVSMAFLHSHGTPEVQTHRGTFVQIYILRSNLAGITCTLQRMESGTRSVAGGTLPSESWDCGRELTLAEKLAVHHHRIHAALQPSVQPATSRRNETGEEAGAQREEGAHRISTGTTSLACLSMALQELDLLEASVLRVRPQRAARGAKKLQSSFPLTPEEAARRPCAADGGEDQQGRTHTTATSPARRCSLPDDCNIMPDVTARGLSPLQSLDLHNVSLALAED